MQLSCQVTVSDLMRVLPDNIGFVYAKANNLWEIESPMEEMLKDFISINQSFAVKNTELSSILGVFSFVEVNRNHVAQKLH